MVTEVSFQHSHPVANRWRQGAGLGQTLQQIPGLLGQASVE
jgi:hypothetical protein